MTSPVDRAISTLNSLHIGDIDRIVSRLGEVRTDLEGVVSDPEILTRIDDARQAITSGDLPLFRKRVQNVVSRLGHLR